MTAFRKFQTNLARSRYGRVALHLICACHDRILRWHLRGIARELIWQKNPRCFIKGAVKLRDTVMLRKPAAYAP